MKIYLTKIFNNNWFFVSLILFVLILPFSQALVSIFAGIIFLTALIEDNWNNKIYRINTNRLFLFLPGIYLIYLISAFISNKLTYSLYDLQKSLFFLVIPLAFLVGKTINEKQKQVLFFSFVFSVFISTLIALINWKFLIDSEPFSVHKASLISHIRFSFQLILAFWFIVFFIQKKFKSINKVHVSVLIIGALYFIFFIFFQQSLTGIFAFLGSLAFYLGFLIFRNHSKFKLYLITVFIVLVFLPVFYVGNVVRKFYNIEKIDITNIEQETAQGNQYYHDLSNPLVENGKYVYLYVCESEMREEWNKISEIKYDSLGTNGFTVKSTLIRYLTSKGLRKDAIGVKSLSESDIKYIQNGISNIIFTKGKFSLYPRIYQTIWEYYMYSKTGNANMQSFSQRIEYAKAALTIIKNKPLFGVGTGNWKEEFKKAYEKNNSKLSEEFYASAHNQYLNYMVKFGVVGFMAIYFFMLFPVFRAKRYLDHLFLIFLVFMFLSNLADSNFESHMGSSFFVFFYCIFMASGKNYLELSWRKQP